MGFSDISISTKLFGLNKQDVKEYFQKLDNEQKKIIEELTRSKRQLERELEKLKKELIEAQKEEVTYEDEVVKSPSSEDEVILDAHSRVEKTTALINILAEEETEQLIRKANEEMEEYDKVIDELQHSIDDNKIQIETLLNDVLRLLKSNAGSVLNKEGKEASQLNDMAHILEKADEKKSVLEKKKNEKLTADGTSLNVINNLLMFRKKYQQEGDSKEEEQPLVPKMRTAKDDIYNIINSYDIEGNNDLNDFLLGTQEDPIDFYQDPVEETISPVAKEPPKQSDDINMMRNSLIIGKVAGEDLLDSEQKVIIPAGKVLDERDIALAEKEGKLPELIVNMVLPQ